MMLLMLCLVFASAGPGVPSVGDVFSMGPTMAYGADPHMLHSAPDWGSGFVLGGRSFTLNLLSPLNASIAGQTCTPGAQEVIAHVPKWPMAGPPSSGARTEGISKIFCPHTVAFPLRESPLALTVLTRATSGPVVVDGESFLDALFASAGQG